MAFSLSNWFKGKPGAPGSENPDETAPGEPSTAAPTAVAAPVAAPAPPPAVRKVVPNSVQPVSLRTPGAPRPVALPVSTPTHPADRAAAMGTAAPRPKIYFGDIPSNGHPDSGTAPVEPPPSIADTTVTLEVGDFYDRLPPGLLQGGTPVDRRRAVEFQASELYSDLTRGRASVPASIIYQKCPELFARPVSETEDTEVSLPLQKLVEQMSQAFQARADQVAEENVGEIETPFLQVAMEDNARLPKAAGTSAGAIRGTASPLNEPPRRPHRTGQIQTISPLKMPQEQTPPMQAAPSASTVAPINPALKRPPSTVRASVAGGKIRLSGPSMPNRMVPVNPVPVPVVPVAPVNEAPPPSVTPVELPPSASQRILPPLQVPGAPTASPSHQVSKKTARIQIPPISLKGAGAGSRPAAPSAVSVQPSPVPVRPGPNAEPVVPPIAFRSSPPPPGTKKMPHSFAPPPLRQPGPPVFPAAPAPAMPSFPASPQPPAAAAPAPALPAMPSGFPAATDDRKISLSLAAVLRGLPLSALTLEPHSVPDEVRVTLPFSLVEGQLAQGRVSVPVTVFSGSLPEGYREVLASNSGLSEVPLPLQEVFQNLPPAALSIRQDQVVEEISHVYPTPFAQKAEEDAERLGSAVKDNAPAAPTPEISMDRPLPPDPVIEPPAPEMKAFAPAEPEPEPAVEKLEEEVPSEEFANLFVEEPPAPARDIPLDFDGDKPTDKEEALSEEPVEAKTSVEEKPEVIAAPEPPRPEPVAEEKQPEPMAEAKAEPVVEAKAELVPEPPKPEVHAEEKPAEAAIVIPPFFVEEKAAPAPEQKREEPAPEPVAAKPVEEPARPAEHAKPELIKAEAVEPASPVSVNGQHAAHAGDKPAAPARQATPAPVVQDTVLQSLFMTEDDLDAKGIVRHVCTLPGVEGCAVMFEDGLQLAGNFPSEEDAEGFSAMAPPFFKRTRNFAGETHLGALRAFTLHTDSGMFSFFMHEHICLSVRHTGRGFLPGVREKLETVTRELARIYATDAQAH